MNHLAPETYSAYCNTDYGKVLAQRARYEGFLPKGCSLEVWESILGRNANNLHHLQQSMDDARDFVDAENSLNKDVFNADDKIVLVLAGCLHDQAEGHPEIGDIPYGTKTNEQKIREIKVLNSLIEEYIENLSSDDKDVYYFRQAQKAVFGDRNNRITAAFQAIEHIGFLNDALRASAQLDKLEGYPDSLQEDTQSIIIALKRLVVEIFGSGVIEIIINLSDQFPSLKLLLDKHALHISKVYQSTTPDIFDWYDNTVIPPQQISEREDRIARFKYQQAIWDEWYKDN